MVETNCARNGMGCPLNLEYEIQRLFRDIYNSFKDDHQHYSNMPYDSTESMNQSNRTDVMHETLMHKTSTCMWVKVKYCMF